jgi:serine/threonine-protein kinase
MLSTGDIIDGKYRIVRLIGEGGMGAVYEGENVRIHRRVAIKVLHSGVASSGEAVARFEREAQAAGRIGSEHIVEVLDLGNLPSGDRYMVMEFMDGDSLGDRIKSKGRLPPQELAPIAIQLMEALSAAHGAGIIHRDLKPDNVYLLKSRSGKPNFVKLLDFGISKFNQLSGDSGFSMTRTGAVMGTPYYMAPEQAKGSRDLDHRVDLYAAGVILYEAVTGEVPFNADTFNELLFKIVLETPRPIEQVVPELDPAFGTLINKAMARDPAARFQTAAEFQEAVQHWIQGAPQAFAPPPNRATPAQVAVPAQLSQSSLGTGTPGNWSSTGNYADAPAAPKKSNGAVFAVVGIVAVLGLGGAALAFRGNAADQEAASKEAAAQAAAAEAKAKEQAAAAQASDAERAKLEKEKNAALSEAQQMKGEAEKAKAAAEEARLKALAEASAKAKVAAAPRPAAKPAAEAPKPAPAPAPAPVSTGRKIRTSL